MLSALLLGKRLRSDINCIHSQHRQHQINFYAQGWLNLILIRSLWVKIRNISTYLVPRSLDFFLHIPFFYTQLPLCKQESLPIWTKIMCKSWGKNKKIKGEYTRICKYSGYSKFIICIVTASYSLKREKCLQTFVFTKVDYKRQFEWFHICFKDL